MGYGAKQKQKKGLTGTVFQSVVRRHLECRWCLRFEVWLRVGGGVVVVVALNVVVFFVVVLLLLLSIDPPNHWDGLKIPAGMLSVKDGKRIVAMMDLERMDMGGALGLQYYDRHLNK
jgi:hypothetical protein